MGARREGHSPRLSLHPPTCILFQRAHACLSHEVPCREGLALLLFPLFLGGSHGMDAGLFDKQGPGMLLLLLAPALEELAGTSCWNELGQAASHAPNANSLEEPDTELVGLMGACIQSQRLLPPAGARHCSGDGPALGNQRSFRTLKQTYRHQLSKDSRVKDSRHHGTKSRNHHTSEVDPVTWVGAKECHSIP